MVVAVAVASVTGLLWVRGEQARERALAAARRSEAARLVAARAARSNPDYRFPAMWGPNFDWIPDQDHGSVMMIALQRMALQYEGNEIRLLPAWPE